MSKKKSKTKAVSKIAKRIQSVYGRIMPEPGGDPAWHPKCNSNKTVVVFWKKIRFVRRFVYAVQYMIPCTRVTFSKDGLFSKDGRTLIWGKFRRMGLSFFPNYSHSLQKKHGISGGCTSCGASCKLLLQCPHWDNKSHLCSIYEDRPAACRLFPITPQDIEDRNIVLKKEPCGFAFQTPVLQADRHMTLRPERSKKQATKKPIPIPPKNQI